MAYKTMTLQIPKGQKSYLHEWLIRQSLQIPMGKSEVANTRMFYRTMTLQIPMG